MNFKNLISEPSQSWEFGIASILFAIISFIAIGCFVTTLGGSYIPPQYGISLNGDAALKLID